MDYNKIRIISFKQQYKPNDVNKEVWISFKQGGCMFIKMKNFIDQYSWLFFAFMILVLFLNYLYPFDASLDGLQLEWLIMTKVFPSLGVLCAFVAILFRKLNLFILAFILYFALWIKLFISFSFFTYFLGV